MRLHVIDFRLEFDLPRFHPLRLSYSKEHYHCAQDGPQEKSSTLLGPLWRLHFWRAVKSWSVRRIALCRPSCRTRTTKSCVQNSDSSSTERFLLVVINLVFVICRQVRCGPLLIGDLTIACKWNERSSGTFCCCDLAGMLHRPKPPHHWGHVLTCNIFNTCFRPLRTGSFVPFTIFRGEVKRLL